MPVILVLQGACQRLALAAVGGSVDSPSKREKPKARKNAQKTRRVPTVSCTHEDGMPSFYTRERRSIQNMVTNFSFYPSKAQFKPVFDLRSENSGMMGGRHHFIPKKLWRKYNAVSMNGDSPNESNGDDRCVRSPAENSGMRPYDLNTGGVRIVTFPSMFRIGLLDDI